MQIYSYKLFFLENTNWKFPWYTSSFPFKCCYFKIAKVSVVHVVECLVKVKYLKNTKLLTKSVFWLLSWGVLDFVFINFAVYFLLIQTSIYFSEEIPREGFTWDFLLLFYLCICCCSFCWGLLVFFIIHWTVSYMSK